jgi:mono/diheme cytochrome c family protein
VKSSHLLLGVVALSALAACRGQTSRDEPIVGIRNMYDQVKYEFQEESKFFPDHRTMRPLVDGVVAHDEEVDPAIAHGRLEDGSGYVLEIPKEVVARHGGMESMLKRGQARYGIYCVPCHDATGSGEGMAKKRAVASGAAAFVPPTFHQDRIRHIPDGQLFATISNGKSNMPPYAMQIPVDDRWAIVGYVRVLQMSQPKLPTQAPLAPTSQGNLGPAPGGTHETPAPPTKPTGATSGLPSSVPSAAPSAVPPTTPEKKP